jgi:hypothetical protein
MKRFRYLLVFFALLLTGGNGRAISGPSQDDSRFIVDYLRTGELYYEQIHVDGTKLIYTRCSVIIQQEKGYVCELQQAYWKKDDLKTDEVTLSKKEVNDLKKQIRKTAFMELQQTYGNSKSRNYAYALEVELDNRKTRVVYYSSLQPTTMPPAFQTVEDSLRKLAKSKFKEWVITVKQ